MPPHGPLSRRLPQPPHGLEGVCRAHQCPHLPVTLRQPCLPNPPPRAPPQPRACPHPCACLPIYGTPDASTVCCCPSPSSSSPSPSPQNDFFPGGTFPMPDAESVIPTLNTLRSKQFDIVIMCTLEHALNHSSFSSNQLVRARGHGWGWVGGRGVACGSVSVPALRTACSLACQWSMARCWRPVRHLPFLPTKRPVPHAVLLHPCAGPAGHRAVLGGATAQRGAYGSSSGCTRRNLGVFPQRKQCPRGARQQPHSAPRPRPPLSLDLSGQESAGR